MAAYSTPRFRAQFLVYFRQFQPVRCSSGHRGEATIATSLFTAVVSIVPTKRRRFLWAAWWTAPPEADPFRKPDASSGGARTREEAHEAAAQAAGQRLVETEGRWAGAWVRVLRGEDPWPKARGEASEPRVQAAPVVARGSRAWALGMLGVGAEASAAEIKRAFRAAALRTHPDRGGEEAAFIDARRALDVALATEGRKRGKRAR